MITNPQKLLRQADEAIKRGDIETFIEIKKRFETDSGAIPNNIMEYFESNFSEEELIRIGANKN